MVVGESVAGISSKWSSTAAALATSGGQIVFVVIVAVGIAVVCVGIGFVIRSTAIAKKA